jgi:hypothetical protein
VPFEATSFEATSFEETSFEETSFEETSAKAVESMTTNPFEQLAATEVPEPPAELARDVHKRLNGRLLVAHTAELMLQAIPFAVGHFLQAMGGSSKTVLTGDSVSPNRRAKARRDSIE